MDILANKQLVFDYLTAFPKSREKDEKLVANIWSNHLKGIGKHPKNITAWELLKMIADETIPNYESLTRASRKLKVVHPELQGKNYKKRQAEEGNVINQLSKFENQNI